MNDPKPLKITIRLRRNTDIWMFSISLMDKELIQKHFPNAAPTQNVGISSEGYTSFTQTYGTLDKHIIPMLTGLSGDDVQKVEIEFIDSLTGQKYDRV